MVINSSSYCNVNVRGANQPLRFSSILTTLSELEKKVKGIIISSAFKQIVIDKELESSIHEKDLILEAINKANPALSRFCLKQIHTVANRIQSLVSSIFNPIALHPKVPAEISELIISFLPLHDMLRIGFVNRECYKLASYPLKERAKALGYDDSDKIPVLKFFKNLHCQLESNNFINHFTYKIINSREKIDFAGTLEVQKNLTKNEFFKMFSRHQFYSNDFRELRRVIVKSQLQKISQIPSSELARLQSLTDISLELPLKYQNYEVLKIMLFNGVSPKTPCYYAKNDCRLSPLSYLILSEVEETKVYLESLEYLIKFGANPNFNDFKGITPLLYAALVGKHQSVKLLLEHGAEVNTQTYELNTALHFACGGGDAKYFKSNIEVIKVLLQYNANLKLMLNKWNCTAYDYAVEKRLEPEILNLLGNDMEKHLQ